MNTLAILNVLFIAVIACTLPQRPPQARRAKCMKVRF
jgi:hypothetical protein